ncbi:UNVERIFIED_CONTAM: hypothetical protein GTU68_037713 [Idotea baltica]|nr:hypothetical protein [Idotea baltica]
MNHDGFQAFIIPSTDPHQSEYVADYWKVREWMTHFSGSAGTAVITVDHAGLWTDSRYFIQAAEELAGSGFELHKTGGGRQSHSEWLKDNLKPGDRVGIDGQLIAQNKAKRLIESFAEEGIDLELVGDLVDGIWHDRPALPERPVFQHDIAYAGKDMEEKLQDLRNQLNDLKADYCLVSALDEVAWLFNLRGSDVDFCPVFYSYALVGMEEVYLFASLGCVPATIQTELSALGVQFHAYDGITSILRKLPDTVKVQFDPAKTAASLVENLLGEMVGGISPIAIAKSIKNEIEIENLEKTMVKDGVALVNLYRWLDSQLESGEKITESQVGEQLATFRSQQAGYVCESFPAIVGYQGNGAIVHYRPEAGKDNAILNEGILLLDSGGQYLDGTTDITRTICLGEPTEEQIHCYTLVLKGHIALSEAVFPAGTSGYQLDILARLPLWKQGLDYGHGTGHGVGFFLNVHEGPHSIQGRGGEAANLPIEPGTITSNEPGYYKEGEFGIRIENLIHCIHLYHSDYGDFYGFIDMTVFPMEFSLIDYSLLGPQEWEWLAEYHTQVMTEMEPYLDEGQMEWVAGKCMPFIQVISMGEDVFEVEE